MAFVHGKNAGVDLDANDLSAYCNSVEFAQSADSHETTTFGNNSKTYAAGLKDGTCTLEGLYDDTAATGPAAVIRPLLGGDTVDLIYRPEGSGTGKPELTVQVVVTSYEESAPVADMVTWTAELQLSGDVTETAQV